MNIPINLYGISTMRRDQKSKKTCLECGKVKDFNEFYESVLEPDGRFEKCKECCPTKKPRNNKSQYKHYAEYFQAVEDNNNLRTPKEVLE